VDLPVTNNDMNSEDTPKGFSRLMRYKEFALQKRKDKMNAKETNTGNSSKPSLQMQPGERLKDFVGRVENQYQSDLLAAQKKTKTVSARKKRNQELRKQKKTAKQQKELEYYGGRDFDDLKDNVKFGEVADAPPILTKLPKARGRGKEVGQKKKKKWKR
ncbi:hypothetical protein BDF20DRAFT_829217, partial [Mycotypha africana]|uniref:uncharacterized protein n=1 Tax=Mycotypha africana TaxID=64632 RepID=UPI00230031A0